MRRLVVLAVTLFGIACLPFAASAQLHGAADFDFPMPVGDFGDVAKPGFGGGAALYYGLPQLPRLQLGGRFAFNQFSLEDPLDGNYRIYEILPSARMMLLDPNDTMNVFNAFLQLGAGAYHVSLNPDTGSGDSSTEFGFQAGVGLSGRFTDTYSFFVSSTYNWINTSGNSISYIPINVGIMF